VIFSLTALVSLVAAPVPMPAPGTALPTELWQVAPDRSGKAWEPPATASAKTRAVVLIHGLHIHPLHPSKALLPLRGTWQEPQSTLVQTLANDSDVFSFSYAQTIPIDDVAESQGLRDAVAKLRKAGYKEIVLVGHSAGGIVARQFFEHYPNAGVTKVIAVASPFAGAEAATLKVGYPKVQAALVKSLTPESRMEATKANTHVLGKDAQIVCVVCKLKRGETDRLVQTRSQWSEELQRLGVPAVLSNVNHFEAMQNPDTAQIIAELVRQKLTRWSPEEVEKARKILFSEMQK
jgi:pimeloyl-ACP methyl ester carboxylesterase